MRLFGYSLSLTKAAVPPVDLSGFRPIIREPFTGAWQRNMEIESPKNLLAFSAVYACVSRICADVAKLRIKLVQIDSNRIWTEIDRGSPFLPVLRKPNRYQTRIQFISQWLSSKLLTGNTYVLKEYDERRVVRAMYVLDPARVTVKVGTDGSVWYEVRRDDLAGQRQENLVLPASDVIHDRGLTPWHPLVGVSPIYACGASTTQGIRIQANAEQFFANQSRPGGLLMPKSPHQIPPNQLDAFKSKIEQSTSGANAGRLLVLSEEMIYSGAGIPPVDAQLIEQLKFTVEDVARPFKMPLYKLGIGQPTFSNINQLSLEYYTDCLQEHIEQIELLLDEGLALPSGYGTEFDLDGLLRMDPISQIEAAEKMVKGMVGAPNEGRRRIGLGPVAGGGKVLSQEQYWPIEILADRPPPVRSQPSVAPPPAEPAPAEPASEERELTELEIRGIKAFADDLIEKARAGGFVA